MLGNESRCLQTWHTKQYSHGRNIMSKTRLGLESMNRCLQLCDIPWLPLIAYITVGSSCWYQKATLCKHAETSFCPFLTLFQECKGYMSMPANIILQSGCFLSSWCPKVSWAYTGLYADPGVDVVDSASSVHLYTLFDDMIMSLVNVEEFLYLIQLAGKHQQGNTPKWACAHLLCQSLCPFVWLHVPKRPKPLVHR